MFLIGHRQGGIRLYNFALRASKMQKSEYSLTTINEKQANIDHNRKLSGKRCGMKRNIQIQMITNDNLCLLSCKLPQSDFRAFKANRNKYKYIMNMVQASRASHSDDYYYCYYYSWNFTQIDVKRFEVRMTSHGE